MKIKFSIFFMPRKSFVIIPLLTFFPMFVILIHQGNDTKPRVRHFGDYNPRCIAYNAWWEVSSSSCFGQRWDFIVFSLVLCFVIVLGFSNICCADGYVAACVDVLQITHAAISMVRLFFLLFYSCSGEKDSELRYSYAYMMRF